MTSEAEQFWDTVAERAKADEFVDGRLVLVDSKTGHYYKVVAETWTDGHGNRQARLRDPRPEELAALETGTVKALVLVDET